VAQLTSEFIRHLRTETVARIAELDEERQTLERMLFVLDQPMPPRRKQAHARPHAKQDQLLALIANDPGIRSSMLALTVKRPVEQVTAELTALEGAGVVARKALGWRVA
jgi:predicted Rossmann fold nucleotide-binding protein DprA/Smf involved in DNA uptake